MVCIELINIHPVCIIDDNRKTFKKLFPKTIKISLYIIEKKTVLIDTKTNGTKVKIGATLCKESINNLGHLDILDKTRIIHICNGGIPSFNKKMIRNLVQRLVIIKNNVHNRKYLWTTKYMKMVSEVIIKINNQDKTSNNKTIIKSLI